MHFDLPPPPDGEDHPAKSFRVFNQKDEILSPFYLVFAILLLFLSPFLLFTPKFSLLIFFSSGHFNPTPLENIVSLERGICYQSIYYWQIQPPYLNYQIKSYKFQCSS